MFVIYNRYLIINSDDGIILYSFDDGCESDMADKIVEMRNQGYSMHKHFVLDQNDGHPVPALIWRDFFYRKAK